MPLLKRAARIPELASERKKSEQCVIPKPMGINMKINKLKNFCKLTMEKKKGKNGQNFAKTNINFTNKVYIHLNIKYIKLGNYFNQ